MAMAHHFTAIHIIDHLITIHIFMVPGMVTDPGMGMGMGMVMVMAHY
jgi:hypothetical protein